MWIQKYVCGRTIGNLGWGYVDKYVCGRTIGLKVENMWINMFVVELLDYIGWEYVDKYVCGRTIGLYRLRICG